MRLSKEKQDRIAEQVLSYLFNIFPQQPFTSEIAKDVARDEEFIKRLLFGLNDKGLVIPLKKNSQGTIFTRRIRWRLSKQVYEVYKSRE